MFVRNSRRRSCNYRDRRGAHLHRCAGEANPFTNKRARVVSFSRETNEQPTPRTSILFPRNCQSIGRTRRAANLKWLHPISPWWLVVGFRIAFPSVRLRGFSRGIHSPPHRVLSLDDEYSSPPSHPPQVQRSLAYLSRTLGKFFVTENNEGLRPGLVKRMLIYGEC